MIGLAVVAAAWAAEPLVEVPLSALLSDQRPVVLGQATARPCVGDRTTLDEVQAAVDAAEKALTFLELAAAAGQLERASNALVCLSEPAAGNLVARVPYLEGMVAFYEGRREAAAQAFLRAHVQRPGLDWDANYAPDAQPLFDEAARVQDAMGTVPLTLVPAGLEVWVDGRPLGPSATLELAPGPHLLQVPAAGWEALHVDLAGPAQLVVPGAAGHEGGSFGPLLTAVLPAGTPVSLTVDGERLHGTVGDAAWVTAPVDRRWGPSVAAVGGTLTAGGLAVGLGGLFGVRAAQELADASTTWAEVQAASGRHQGAGAWLVAGQATVAVGVGVLAGGLVATWLEERVR